MLDVGALAPSDGPRASEIGEATVMAELRTVPHGSWASPITSDLIVASSIGLGDILVDGRDIYWIESRPQERGRSVVVRHSQDEGPADVTPPLSSDGQAVFKLRSPVQ